MYLASSALSNTATGVPSTCAPTKMSVLRRTRTCVVVRASFRADSVGAAGSAAFSGLVVTPEADGCGGSGDTEIRSLPQSVELIKRTRASSERIWAARQEHTHAARFAREHGRDGDARPRDRNSPSRST